VSPGSPYLLLVNPAAARGRAAALVPRLESALAKRGLEHRTVVTRSAEHACAEAGDGAAAGEIPVIVSGDGLIGKVGGALAGNRAVIGIVPAGRGNDLARGLGIPADPEAAIEALGTAPVREIDVGEVNGVRFLGIASCGFDSDANRIANEARVIGGNLVYAYAALRALVSWQPARFTVTVDGARVEIEGFSVAAANNRAYGGGMLIAPDAEIDDGLIDVVATGVVGKLRFLVRLPQVFRGTHVDNHEVTVLRGSEVAIEADRPFAVYADGDHVTDLPATVRVLPRALGVLAPVP